MNTQEAVKKEIEGLHFVGKDHFYFNESKEDRAAHRQAINAIDKCITKKIITKGCNIPQLSEYDFAILEAELYKELLRRAGATEEEINELEREATQAAQAAINEHREHAQGFTVVK